MKEMKNPKTKTTLAPKNVERSSAKRKQCSNSKANEKHAKYVKNSEAKSGKFKKTAVKKEQVTEKEREREDGEVSGEDSSNEAEMPVCRFHSTDSCTWGHYCRFRHPASRIMGNYEMFKQSRQPLWSKRSHLQGIYPTAPWMSYPSTYPKELDSSFQHNLRDFKQLMQASAHKRTQDNNPYEQHKPWIEFNDLDTDPYYTNQLDLPDPVQHSSQVNHPCLMDPSRKVTIQLNDSPSSRSSSSSEYSSTTNSSSSSSCCSSKPVKLRTFTPKKKGRACTKNYTYSSDSETYESTTNSEEFNSSSSDYNSRKSEFSTELERRRRRYLKRKLKYVEALINRKEKKLK